jgi:DNA-binding NtrC family response regulator
MPWSCQTREFLGVPAVFASDAMRGVLSLVEKVARSSAAVFVTGESGSGKELIARALHHHSPRMSKSWVDVSCAALPENLLESELFGYEKGAFSGAGTGKPGLFELAHQGTLFLDEVGELDLRMQVKLLRVLDGVPYYRLGGVRKVMVDVRMVTATNQDLKAAVLEGRFRADLYHRLCQITITVPPLRERKDDILPLAMHFLSLERPGSSFSAGAAQKLRDYSWPGNVRELKNVVIRTAILSNGSEIGVTDLPDELQRESYEASLQNLAGLDALERAAILEALQQVDGHQQRAANKLGISKRTLQRKIKSYAMRPGDLLSATG